MSVLSVAPTRACFCGEKEARVRFRTARYGLMTCTSCGCYRIDPPPIRTEEEAGGFYTSYYAGMRSEHPGDGAPDAGVAIPERSSRFWNVAAQVPSLLVPGHGAADIGCGEGRLCAELRQAGWEKVIGVDASAVRVARARRAYPDISFHESSLEDVRIPARSLDLIVLDNVIEHVVDPLDAVTRLRGFLTSSGRLVLITPNMESGHFRLLGRRWTPELAPHAHIFLFTHDAMRRMLTSAGFVVETQGDFHLPGYPIGSWLRRMASGDVKGAVWRGMQEMGGIYGRFIGAGPMLFAVARVAQSSRSMPGAQP